MKKLVNWLHTAGCIVFVIGLVWNWQQGFLLRPASNGGFGDWLIYGGAIMLLPQIAYQFYHYNQYRKKNRENLIFALVMLVLVVTAIIVKR